MIPYCLNIHPGGTLSEVRESIIRDACAVRNQLAYEDPYPIGLRLAATVVDELLTGEALASFAALFDQHHLRVAGINGFPYGTFHGRPVKTAVYQPDWSTPERLEYTAKLISILSLLQPAGVVGSITTLPLAYRNVQEERKRLVNVRQMILIAELLDTLLQEERSEIVLAVEPEPDCLLDDTAGFIAWFEEELLCEAKKWMCAHHRRTPDAAEEIVRRHIGICFDTCHFAVGFEDPLDSLKRIERAGIRVGRIQLSAAIRAQISDESLQALGAFIEPVYLHQTRIRKADGTMLAFPDLTSDLLSKARDDPGGELRTHFHVPLFWQGNGILNSTQADLTPDFFTHLRKKNYPMEIETYTFNVLPPELRAENVVDNLVMETRWAMAQLEEHPA